LLRVSASGRGARRATGSPSAGARAIQSPPGRQGAWRHYPTNDPLEPFCASFPRHPAAGPRSGPERHGHATHVLWGTTTMTTRLGRMTGVLARDQKPNILFILAENLGYGELGSYGGGATRGASTAALDQLASDGLTNGKAPGQDAGAAGRALGFHVHVGQTHRPSSRKADARQLGRHAHAQARCGIKFDHGVLTSDTDGNTRSLSAAEFSVAKRWTRCGLLLQILAIAVAHPACITCGSWCDRSGSPTRNDFVGVT